MAFSVKLDGAGKVENCALCYGGISADFVSTYQFTHLTHSYMCISIQLVLSLRGGKAPGMQLHELRVKAFPWSLPL